MKTTKPSACGLLVIALASSVLAQSPGRGQFADRLADLIEEESRPQPVALEHLAPLTDADFFGYPERVHLGRLLFHDKILSGNMNIACATCHHSLTGTTDWLSLSIGEGGFGLGPARDTGFGPTLIPERVPRNAPAVFNLGALQIDRMFHDGRVQVDPAQPSGFLNPAGDALPVGFEHVLEVQAMFPVTAGTEMAGQAGENTIADAAALNNLAGPGGVWEQLADRLRAIPEYVDLFIEAFDDIDDASDITYAHAAKAIGSFEAIAWRFDDSPFDRVLRGDDRAMSRAARRGMNLFYGRAGCADCHAGVLQTDQEFHSIGMPQIGPGKGDNIFGFADGLDDFGRERVTGDGKQRYRFRTPTLRNVALTGPWGHDGAYNTLEGVVRHHLNPYEALENYDTSQAVLPAAAGITDDFLCHNDPARRAEIMASVDLAVPLNVSDDDLADLLAFLESLTDFRAVTHLRDDVPNTVPSGLPVGD
ncbi:MAG: hypothetical protein KDA21_01480 [Phycisphaerales bacterium]|nr:hypothetical protein [Phycisphaerales bacterium]